MSVVGCLRRACVLLLVAVGVAYGGAATAAVRSYPAPPRVLRPGQHPYSSLAGSVRLNYLLYAPAAYAKDPKRRWPLIVFLHGSGERGTDPLLVEAQPLPKTLATTTSFPAVVLSPQAAAAVLLVVGPDRARRRARAADRDALPHRSATRVPDRAQHGRLRHLALRPAASDALRRARPDRRRLRAGEHGRSRPTSAFCAGRRSGRSMERPTRSSTPTSRRYSCRRCGRAARRVVRLTLYPGVDHFGSWPRAYADPALWKWLFAQRRP